MQDDAEFCRIALQVRRKIYESGIDAQLDMPKEHIWHQSLNQLMKQINPSKSFGVELRKIINGSRKNLSARMQNADTLLNRKNFIASINQLILDESNKNLDFVDVDEDWKAKVTSYIYHIREAVTKADVIEALRERIFDKLNRLQAEVDRNRTYTQSVSEVFLAITEAMGKGAKNLGAAVRLVERLGGAVSGLRTAKIEHQTQLKLPAPQDVGLSELGTDDAERG